MSIYGKENPYKELKIEDALNSPRKHITMTYTPSSVEAEQDLIVKIPKLGSNQVLCTNTLKLTFDFNTENKDIINNLGRNLISRLIMKIGNQTIQDINDFDIFHVYKDLWLSDQERYNRIQSGIDDTLRY